MLTHFSTEGKALSESPAVTETSHGIVAGIRQWAGPPRSSTGLPEWLRGERLVIAPAQKLSGWGESPKAKVTNCCWSATTLPDSLTAHSLPAQNSKIAQSGGSNQHCNGLQWWDPARRVWIVGQEEERLEEGCQIKYRMTH